MSDRCDAGRIQDFLDGELDPAARESFAEHLRGCEACAAELALYRRTFEALDRMPLLRPSSAFDDRVLDRVLPGRVRRRWARVVGLGYAALSAAMVTAAALWLAQPVNRAALQAVTDDLSRRLVEAVFFALNAVAFAVVSLVNGWGLIAATSERIAPFLRALGALLSNSGVQIALATAAVACVVVLWWIRPRDKRPTRGVRHVGIVGF
jgi:anti-sigma factor RsiW